MYNLKVLAYIHDISTLLTLCYSRFMAIHTFAAVDLVAVVKVRGPTLVRFEAVLTLKDHVWVFF